VLNKPPADNTRRKETRTGKTEGQQREICGGRISIKRAQWAGKKKPGIMQGSGLISGSQTEWVLTCSLPTAPQRHCLALDGETRRSSRATATAARALRGRDSRGCSTTRRRRRRRSRNTTPHGCRALQVQSVESNPEWLAVPIQLGCCWRHKCELERLKVCRCGEHFREIGGL
jgi:hypothetical protein